MILEKAMQYAARLDTKAVAITFDPNTRALALAVEEAFADLNRRVASLEAKVNRLEHADTSPRGGVHEGL
jgi:hypothetical protein